MPTVPVIDQTAQGTTPFGAPGVAPVRSAAPEQIQDLGRAVSQAGGVATKIGSTIGDRVQEQVDDANTKAAETSFLKASQSILYDPQKGYFRQQGKSAVDQYEPTQQAISKASDDALGTLTNPIQKQMFQQVAQQHLLTFGKSMADYNHAQSVAWSAGESKARADSQSIMALGAIGSRYLVDDAGAPTGDYAKYTAQMDKEVLNAANLAGFDPASAQAKAMIREQRTQLNQAIISNLLDKGDGYGADKWFNEQSAAGNIDLRNLTALGSAVKNEYERQHVNNGAQSYIASATADSDKPPVTRIMVIPGGSVNVTDVMGSPRADGRQHNGIDIAVPVGTKFIAPAAGKVTKVWNDEQFGGGLSVEMQHADGSISGFAHLSATNVRVGDEVQQGSQLGLTGKSGNATGPTLHYMAKDPDGNYVDPRQASQPQPNKDGFADPAALDRALKSLQASTEWTPDQKRSIQNILESEHTHLRTMQNEEQAQTFKQAGDAFYKTMNVESIPPSLFSKLTPEQQHKFRDEQTSEVLKNYSQGQQLREMGSVDLQSYFIQNPDMITSANVDAARPKLSNSDYLQLQKKAQEFQNNPQGVQEAQGVNDSIKYFASHSGINVNPKTPEDKQTLNDINTRVNQDINQIKAQNHGKATQDQVNKAIQQELIRRTVTTPRSPWNPLALFSPNSTSTLPLGTVKTARGSDGKDHYLDRNNQDLGVVK